MDRRNFLLDLGVASTAWGSSRTPEAAYPTESRSAPQNFSDVAAVGPGDLEAYFTEEKLRQAIDTTVPLGGTKFEVVAYNFPSWHPSAVMEKLFGKGWTEFETLKNSDGWRSTAPPVEAADSPWRRRRRHGRSARLPGRRIVSLRCPSE